MNHHVELFVRVDHHTFTLQDERACWNGTWTNRSFLADGVGVAPGVVSVVDATRASGDAPVLVELRSAPPDDSDADDYDGVVDAHLQAPSGDLRIVNGTDVFPIGTVPPGPYRARIYYGNADAADLDGDAGADHYRIAVWPSPGASIAPTDIYPRVPKPRFSEWERRYAGPRGRGELARWLGDARWTASAVSHRCLATVALLRLGDLDTVRRAQEHETSRAVQAVYASAVWLVGDDAIDILAGMTLSRSAVTRRRAVQSLLRLGGSLAEKLVLSLVNDPDGSVRAAAAAGVTRSQRIPR